MVSDVAPLQSANPRATLCSAAIDGGVIACTRTHLPDYSALLAYSAFLHRCFAEHGPACAWDQSSQELFSTAATKQLDWTIKEVMTTDNLPSVAVDVAMPGKGTYIFVSGFADLQTGAKRNSRQPFLIASLTKTFVATAVLQLVDRGKLQTIDFLAKW